MVPNFQPIVERLARQYPQEWKDAHTGNARTEDFVRIVAWELHKLDPKVGLNGKRGNYEDISDDVINYFGEGPGFDPKTNSPITVVDFIARAGAKPPDPPPYVTWQPFSNLPGPGAWVKPTDPFKTPLPEIPKPVEPVKPPYPGDNYWKDFGKVLADDYHKKQEMDGDSVIWAGRVIWDHVVNGMKLEEAVEKQRNGPDGWQKALGNA